MPQTRIIYIGIFLSWWSRRKLLKEYPQLHVNLFADHVTLAFRPDATTVKGFTLGKRAGIVVYGHIKDDKGQAALCYIAGGDLAKEHHITISTAKNIPPVYSQRLMTSKGADMVLSRKAPMHLYGRVRAYTGKPPTLWEQIINLF